MDELTKRASDSANRFVELSQTIKDAEKRMAEIAVLKTHIINYSRRIFAKCFPNVSERGPSYQFLLNKCSVSKRKMTLFFLFAFHKYSFLADR